jgi:hypothetical protein
MDHCMTVGREGRVALSVSENDERTVGFILFTPADLRVHHR